MDTKQIAHYLSMQEPGRTWDVMEQDGSRFTCLEDGQGHTICLYLDEYHHKAEISGRYPRMEHNNQPCVRDEDEAGRIKVNPDKSPLEIAKDIYRRFVPKYLAAYGAAMQRYREYHAQIERAKRMQAELIEAWDGRTYNGNGRDPREVIVSVDGAANDRPWGKLEWSAYSGHVHLELHSLSEGEALALGRAFKSLMQAR